MEHFKELDKKYLESKLVQCKQEMKKGILVMTYNQGIKIVTLNELGYIRECLRFYYESLVYPYNVSHFKIDPQYSQYNHLHNQRSNQTITFKTIAIIGAGGSSASYWLKETFNNSNSSSLKFNTTIYEKSSIIGGRAKVVEFESVNGEKFNIELGGSLFIDSNYHIINASKQFGLEFIYYGEETPNARNGMWNGEKFVFEQSTSYYWDLMIMTWRYGLAPIKVNNLIQATINKFLNIYYLVNPFTSIDSAIEKLDLSDLVKFTGEYYFSEIQKINQNYLYDIIEPVVRVNYAQNLNEIHAMGVYIGSASIGAKKIKGGNYQLFEKFAEYSEANIKLNSKVIKITKRLSDTSLRYLVQTEDGNVDEYDGIILATPIEVSGIIFENISKMQEIKEIPYVTLHVTLVAGNLNPNYFGKTSFDDLPLQIVTTNSPKVEFLSLTTERILSNGETVNKIFTLDYLSDEILSRIYLNTSWNYRQVWKSYPKLLPNQTFPPIEIDDNFFYINSFEPFISTMETETVSSKNIVNIIAIIDCLQDIFEYLRSDNNALHSCILVNKIWCEAATPILWSDPFKTLCSVVFYNNGEKPAVESIGECYNNNGYKPKYKEFSVSRQRTESLLKAFLYWATEQQKNSLKNTVSKFKKKSRPNFPRTRNDTDFLSLINSTSTSTFDYPFFMRTLDLKRLSSTISIWLNDVYDSSEPYFVNVSILQKLECSSDFPKEIFTSLSKVCQNIEIFKMTTNFRENVGLNELIKVQKCIKHVELYGKSDYSDLLGIFPHSEASFVLYSNDFNSVKLHYHTNMVNILPRCENLKVLKLEIHNNLPISLINPLTNSSFVNLIRLEIYANALSLGQLSQIIGNTDGKLTYVSIDCWNLSDLDKDGFLFESVANYCPDLLYFHCPINRITPYLLEGVNKFCENCQKLQHFKLDSPDELDLSEILNILGKSAGPNVTEFGFEGSWIAPSSKVNSFIKSRKKLDRPFKLKVNEAFNFNHLP
nr:10102_t:CDS:10 [Entrophospora candida]